MGLMRRMPPKHVETALSALLSLMPDHSSDLLSQVDQPLQVPLPISQFLCVSFVCFDSLYWRVLDFLSRCWCFFMIVEVLSSICAIWLRDLDFGIDFRAICVENKGFRFAKVLEMFYPAFNLFAFCLLLGHFWLKVRRLSNNTFFVQRLCNHSANCCIKCAPHGLIGPIDQALKEYGLGSLGFIASK